MSFAQQRLWFLDQLEPGSAEYNIPPIVLRMAGPLDEAALRRALETIVARHEVLRTRLVTIDGAGYQVIDPAGGSRCGRLTCRRRLTRRGGPGSWPRSRR